MGKNKITSHSNSTQGTQISQNIQIKYVNGPHIENSLMNQLNLKGDQVIKRVNFQDYTILCQYLQNSPPISFIAETSELLLALNDEY